MGFWRNVFGLGEVVSSVTDASAPTFAVDATSVDPAVFGLEGYAPSTAPAPRIDRRSAIQVPAVKRTRDLIAGTLGGLPLNQFDPNKRPIVNPLFEQPERNVPRSVTMTRLFEDMLFEQVAWWQVTERTWDRWPLYVKRLKPGRVTVDEERDKVYVDGREADQGDLIRFDSPTEGLLIAGARAIRTCLLLDTYAANAAQGIPPLDWFTDADDLDPLSGGNDDEDDDEDDEIAELLANWAESRRTRTTAYIPRSLKYNIGGFDPKSLQLADQRQHAVLEIARHGGIDPEDLGVSTTSRTYANQFDRRKAFTDFTLGLYMKAGQDRLSMGDVSPRGHKARFDLDDFLRSDPAGRWAAYKVGLEVGALADDEIRPMEDKPELTASQKSARKPATPPAIPAAPDPTVAPATVVPLRSAQ